MVSVSFQGKPFNTTVIKVYSPTSNTEEAEVEQFYEDLQYLLELIRKKDILFLVLPLAGLVSLHRTIQLELLHH